LAYTTLDRLCAVFLYNIYIYISGCCITSLAVSEFTLETLTPLVKAANNTGYKVDE